MNIAVIGATGMAVPGAESKIVDLANTDELV